MQINPVSWVTVLIFAPLGALAAFLITYEEYQHRFSGKREPLKHALSSAAFAFIVFALVGILVGLLIK